jgi:hypothetical protein
MIYYRSERSGHSRISTKEKGTKDDCKAFEPNAAIEKDLNKERATLKRTEKGTTFYTKNKDTYSD